MKHAFNAARTCAFIAPLALAISMAGIGASSAQNLVTNGGFTADSPGYLGTEGSGIAPSGWVMEAGVPGENFVAVIFGEGIIGRDLAEGEGFYFPPGWMFGSTPQKANVWGSENGGSYTGTRDSMDSPSGGNFFGGEGSPDLSVKLSQTIEGLVVGQVYELSFEWAAGELVPYESNETFNAGWQVSFGSDSVTVMSDPLSYRGFQSWQTETYSFTATATSQVLAFLSSGSPSGAPPISLLDNISLTQVPEPSVGLLAGLCAAFALGFRRRKA